MIRQPLQVEAVRRVEVERIVKDVGLQARLTPSSNTSSCQPESNAEDSTPVAEFNIQVSA